MAKMMQNPHKPLDESVVFHVHDITKIYQMGRVGQRNGLSAQILEGVNEGETVINHPSDEVADGKRVTRY